MAATIDAAETLPRWNLDSVFPGPESPEFRAALDNIASGTLALAAHFDQEGVGTRPPGAVDAALVATFEAIVTAYNALLEDAMTVDGYLFCLVADDVRNEAAQGAASEWRQATTGLAGLAPRFTAWAGALDLDALAAQSPLAREHLPALRRWRVAATHLMDAGQEDLAAALGPTGGGAWSALHQDLAGRAMAVIEIDGEERELPLSEIENLVYLPDREVRRRAYEAAQAGWGALAVPLAAALNGVKGEQLTLSQRRGWADPLDAALFEGAIDRATLDAMMAAIHEALPDFRRFLRAKARLLGLPVLAGYDVNAPVGEAAPWPFATAQDFIVAQFDALSPRFGDLARRAFAERWIDAETRPGKDGGAFSMPVGGDASRILLNYLPVYDWMSTLAHELGHTYHSFVVPRAGRTMLQAPADDVPAPHAFPMTLGETASTFCEALVQRAARAGATPPQEVALLDGWLGALSLSVFGVLPYFHFEQEVFALRRQRALSPAELNEMMISARQMVTGDAVDPATLWATSWVAPHFFMDHRSYYNFPYAFGMLLGLGLLAVSDERPEGFIDRFDAFLADSGMCEAAELAARFDIDLRDPAFWRTSLDTFRADVARYEELAEELSVER
jgi:oligoendopeptidase F